MFCLLFPSGKVLLKLHCVQLKILNPLNSNPFSRSIASRVKEEAYLPEVYLPGSRS